MVKEVLEWVAYFAGYLGAGLFLKAGDDLLDETHRQDLAWGPLALSGLLFGLLMSTSEWDLILLSGIILAVIASGKVNRIQFSIGFAMIIIVLIILGLPIITAPLDLAAILMLLFMAAVLDEKGSDWADQSVSPRAHWLFEKRFTLKAVVLLLSIPWPLFLPSAVGLWFFDTGYELSGYVARRMITQESGRQDYSRHP